MEKPTNDITFNICSYSAGSGRLNATTSGQSGLTFRRPSVRLLRHAHHYPLDPLHVMTGMRSAMSGVP